MSDEEHPDAIVMLTRIADKMTNHLGIAVYEVACDDCGEPCWRSRTTPTVHVYEDGHVVAVRSICSHCIGPYLSDEDSVEAQRMTTEQRDELLRAEPRLRPLIERIEADPEFRGTLAELLMRLGIMAAKRHDG